jgi:hypothetical protein
VPIIDDQYLLTKEDQTYKVSVTFIMSQGAGFTPAGKSVKIKQEGLID